VTWVRHLVLATALFVVIGCTEGLRGVPMKPPAATGKVVGSVTKDEPGGLIVLWDGESLEHREAHSQSARAWVAGSEEEFEDVWKAAASGKPPRVDFGTYVVLATLSEGNYAAPKIQGIDVEASGLLVPRFVPWRPESHLDNLSPMARVIAVPRRILPTTVVFFDGYAFEVPDLPFG